MKAESYYKNLHKCGFCSNFAAGNSIELFFNNGNRVVCVD